MKKIYKLTLNFIAIKVALPTLLAQIPTNGLINKYRFEGSLTADSVSSMSLSSGGSTALNYGYQNLQNTAAYFNGNGELVYPNSFMYSSFTLSTWVYIENANYYHTIGSVRINYGTYPYNSFNLCVGANTSNKLTFYYNTDDHINSGATSDAYYQDFDQLATGTWYHVAVTVDYDSNADESLITLYKNGSSIGSNLAQGQIAYYANPLVLGNIEGGVTVGSFDNGLKGNLDEVLIYDRALTANEMVQTYNYYMGITPGQGLTAQYPFNGNANDEVGSYDGVLNGNVSLTTDRFGNSNSAYQFDGVDDFITFPAEVLPLEYSNFAISLWVNPANTHFNTAIMQKHEGTSAGGFYLQASGGSSNQQIGSVIQGLGGTRSINSTINLNQWHHIVINHNYAIGDELFVDGVSHGYSNISYGNQLIGSDNALLSIGRALNTSSYFSGKIDDISIYDRPLASNEIAELFDPSSSGLIENNFEFSIFPNPAREQVSIEVPTECFASIFNISGKLIAELKLNEIVNNIDVSAYQKGVYFIQIGNSIQKFIKN